MSCAERLRGVHLDIDTGYRCRLAVWLNGKGQISSRYPGRSPGFRPGFRQVRTYLRPARDQLATFLGVESGSQTGSSYFDMSR